MDYIKQHIAFKNPKILFNNVIETAARLIQKEYFKNTEEALNASYILNSFLFAGKNELSEEEIYKISNQIRDDCFEYSKKHRKEIIQNILGMEE